MMSYPLRGPFPEAVAQGAVLRAETGQLVADGSEGGVELRLAR
ncbi:hypothetical protein [Asanoa siamensis]|nr:hypothetical protein [Asanoa siamensis]